MAKLRILISGGGIAGNALAFWLSKLGHGVTVVERHPTLRDTGLQLDLRGHGIAVLQRMGLEQAFRSRAAPEQGLQIVDRTGRRRASFPANTTGRGVQDFTTDHEIMRGDLCRLLYDETRTLAGGPVTYVFGIAIESFEETERGVEVRFANGATDCFDLLVGADGQRSRTRKMMLGTAAGAPDALVPLDGVYFGYFTLPRAVRPGEGYMASCYIGTGWRSIMTRRHSPQAIQVYLMGRTDSERMRHAGPGDSWASREAMAEWFRGAGWEADELTAQLLEKDVVKDFYCEELGLVQMDSWSRGRVVLVGDAAYCPTPTTGMGTTSAMVGAYVLAGEIGRHCGDAQGREGLPAALKEFQNKFRPFMAQVQRGVSRDMYKGLPSSAFGVALINIVTSIASFLKLNVIGQHFLKEDVKGWDLPEYRELSQG